MFAVANKKTIPFVPDPNGFYVMTDRVQNPDNLGALSRTAEAFGASGLVLAGGCDLYAPKALRASMGALLLSSGAKGKRMALPNSEIMIHQPLIMGGGISGQATDIKIRTDNLLRTKSNLNRILAENTGKELAQIERDVERDYFMTAEEALNYGLIDKVVTKR